MRSWRSGILSGAQGNQKVTLGVGGGVTRDSRVVASITEIAKAPKTPPTPIVGDSHMRVFSVAPQENGNVDLRIEIDWTDNTLLYRITLFIDGPGG